MYQVDFLSDRNPWWLRGYKSQWSCCSRIPASIVYYESQPRFFVADPYKEEGLKQRCKVELLFTCSDFITKLANGLKRWHPLKDPPHAKDYAIKPLRYLLRFLLRSFSPYGWFPFKA
jgi:hypothetical protein